MKAHRLPDKIYVREYQDGDYTTWWDEKPHEEESIGMKAVCYICKGTLLELLKPEKDIPFCDDYERGCIDGRNRLVEELLDKLNKM